jgi:hypothetical protein
MTAGAFSQKGTRGKHSFKTKEKLELGPEGKKGSCEATAAINFLQDANIKQCIAAILFDAFFQLVKKYPQIEQVDHFSVYFCVS